MNLNFNLPKNTYFIINKLSENGYKAYIVGGCVRDLIMNITPHDWDICTNALPDELINIFKDFRTVLSGIKHGTVGIIIENALYEVTTFRSETGYSDNRHPDCVHFEKDIQSDLSRRDFTINSIAYNHKDGLIDLYNGYDDIQHKIIKAVGNPDTRFSEDALRILRALRFSSVLCFEIESSTAESIHRNKDLLKNIACERIWSEFTKLLSGKNAHTVIEKYCDVIGVFIPELYAEKNFQQHNPHHCYDVLHHTLSALSFAENNIYLRLAVLFHDSHHKFASDPTDICPSAYTSQFSVIVLAESFPFYCPCFCSSGNGNSSGDLIWSIAFSRETTLWPRRFSTS